jgi:predicted butyrate kinase (DUF1464 family)
MPRVVGIDPGTVSFDLCGLDDGRVFLDSSMPSVKVAEDPGILVEALKAAGPLDLIAGPSGYGLPFIRVEDVGEREIALTILVTVQEREQIAVLGGLRRLVLMMQQERLPVIFTPGVIHLATVPYYRKANRIDMGTADKLACCVLALLDQSRRHGIEYHEASFVLVELGGAYTAVMAVSDGRVVDGLGGTTGGPGFYSLGAMDGELAYLLGGFPKSILFSGGAADIAGARDLSPEAFAAQARGTPGLRDAWEAVLEGVVKSVAAEMTVVPKAREVLLSGRLCRTAEVREELTRRLSRFAPVRYVEGIASVAKEAAQGTAIMADGLAGGRHAPLVDAMGLRGASGTALDYLYVAGRAEVRQRYA